RSSVSAGSRNRPRGHERDRSRRRDREDFSRRSFRARICAGCEERASGCRVDAHRRRQYWKRSRMDRRRLRRCRRRWKSHRTRAAGRLSSDHGTNETFHQRSPAGEIMKPKIVTFGESLLRLAPPGFERFLQTPNFSATFGGAEANVAVALSSLGMDVAYV